MKQKAIIAICLVALSFSLLNVSVRFMNAGFTPFSQVYLRIALGLLLTWVVFNKEIHMQKFFKISKKDWLLLFLMGTVGYGFAVDFITLGVLHTKLLNASIISSTTPFFVFLFTVTFFKKSFRYSLLSYLLLGLYGVYVIATKSLFSSVTQFNSGDFYVLLFAVGFGVYVLGRKSLSPFLNNSEIAVIVMSIAFLSSFITAVFLGDISPVNGFFNHLALFGLLLGGILNLVSAKLQNFGFEHLDAVVGPQLMLLQNVFALFFGFALYGEIISFFELVGSVLVIIGVVAYLRHSSNQK